MTIEELARARNAARARVDNWINDEYKQGRLHAPSAAPAWQEYAARKALESALEALGT